MSCLLKHSWRVKIGRRTLWIRTHCIPLCFWVSGKWHGKNTIGLSLLQENGEFQSLTLEQREKKRALEQAAQSSCDEHSLHRSARDVEALAVLKDTYSSEAVLR